MILALAALGVGCLRCGLVSKDFLDRSPQFRRERWSAGARTGDGRVGDGAKHSEFVVREARAAVVTMGLRLSKGLKSCVDGEGGRMGTSSRPL